MQSYKEVSYKFVNGEFRGRVYEYINGHTIRNEYFLDIDKFKETVSDEGGLLKVEDVKELGPGLECVTRTDGKEIVNGEPVEPPVPDPGVESHPRKTPKPIDTGVPFTGKGKKPAKPRKKKRQGAK